MSILYTQISEEAAKQRRQLEQASADGHAAEADKPSGDQPAEIEGQAQAEPANRSGKSNVRTDKPIGTAVRHLHTPTDATKPIDESNEKANTAYSEPVSLIDEMKNGLEDDGRPTERYSFEIYTDQKDRILEIKYRYEKRTSKRLPKSRIIREALDMYFQQVLAVE